MNKRGNVIHVCLTVLAGWLVFGVGLPVNPAKAEVPTETPVFSNPLEISNPYHPFSPGGVKVFTGHEGGTREIAAHLYLTETRMFKFDGQKVECRILREIAIEDGELVEVSDNYFAQADDGTVYYFGEVVDDYEGGMVVSHEGSWLVGGPTLRSDPADAGNAPSPAVFMPANPEAGDIFKPEDLFPLVDETAEVLAVGVTVKTSAGTFEDCIEVEESSRLSSGTETKWYAPGVGVVREKAPGQSLKLISSTLLQPKD
ncbi:MAG: hypothetical protein L0Y58_17975 [Verrucomicrobia subdivision 3 bacterium]|nr:hypothetical protein [Limisphaerales bacterium]